MLNILASLGIITSTDVLIITISFILVYTYNWLNLKTIIFDEIDVAYAAIKTLQGAEGTDDNANDVYADEYTDDEKQKEFTFEVSIPYDPVGIIGPIAGAALKSVLMAFVLFVLINIILLVASAACTYNYESSYMEADLKQVILELETENGNKDAKGGTLEYLASKISDISDIANTKGGDANARANTNNESTDEDFKIEPTPDAENQDNENVKEKKKKRTFHISNNIKGIWIDPSQKSLNKTDIIFTKVRLYWLFFVANLYIPIVAVCACLVVNLVAVKLIIPHIVDIEKDPTQMKCQVQVLLYANYAIFVGAIWYLAFKTIS